MLTNTRNGMLFFHHSTAGTANSSHASVSQPLIERSVVATPHHATDRDRHVVAQSTAAVAIALYPRISGDAKPGLSVLDPAGEADDLERSPHDPLRLAQQEVPASISQALACIDQRSDP